MSDELFDLMTKQLIDLKVLLTELYNEMDSIPDNNFYEISRISNEIIGLQFKISKLEKGLEILKKPDA